ncbi:chymotrypsin-2-like [Musca vetustissima]|uniref:chymotrypsin-2-like n=1 Tax=Musca vetustissima TaxID=27455 RepID=UPI002AB73E40|nr:chymotrypsin-2-like [Musca vetustissima]
MFEKLVLFVVLLAVNWNSGEASSDLLWDLDAYFDAMDAAGNSQDRIVGGDNVPDGEYIPYQVSIQYLKNNTNRHFCGGSIITPNRILTAAHCVVGQNPERISILAGVIDLQDTTGFRSQVTRIDSHEDFKPIKGNDIAILDIEPALELDGQRMDTINVDYSEPVGSDEKSILTGWGSIRQSRTSPIYPNHLQRLSYRTMSNAICKWQMRSLTETEICAKSDRGTGACAGDSGGPLAMQRNGETIQVGIVSYGRRKCGSDGLDVYTRVGMFNEWIKERI